MITTNLISKLLSNQAIQYQSVQLLKHVLHQRGKGVNQHDSKLMNKWLKAQDMFLVTETYRISKFKSR